LENRAGAKGLPASVQARLVRHANATGIDPNAVLARFAAERFLYRLSRSRHADRFVLKGALLMIVWLGDTIRPTRDADLLGFGDLSPESLGRMFTDVCNSDVEPDGLRFLASSVRVAPIREEDPYGGLRATIQARLGNARLHVQVDVGIGDAVVPEPEWLTYPGLLEFPQARLRAYRAETAIAEKLHAMVVLGEVNSRMRDFFDIYVLAEHNRFDADLLTRAVRATFERNAASSRRPLYIQSGSWPDFHLTLHPTLGVCSGGTGFPRSSASAAVRRSEPVTGILFPGRLPSNCPRYASRRLRSNRKKSGVQIA
jgi:predicted nucleotidyltransferase component of viral defense system